jgi:tetratricopeptide (TPR) repeat protein
MLVNGLATRALVFGLMLAVAGCTGVEERDSGPAPVTKEPDYTPTTPPVTPPQPPARPPRPATSSAWQPLVDKAAQAAARGDYDRALALLERAQRIDPESSAIYLQLARTHKARGNAAQARAMAERGMLFCSGQAECSALRAYTQ